MFVPFENMPDESKIWIYPCNRKFSDTEIESLHKKLTDFTEQWAAHGKPLSASYLLPYNRFIILVVDETNQHVTGCSIDASVGFIQEIEKELQVDLLDKLNVTFKLGEFVSHKTLADFKKMAKDKAVSENTIVFNNLVSTYQDYLENWETTFKNSWHHRVFTLKPVY